MFPRNFSVKKQKRRKFANPGALSPMPLKLRQQYN